MVSAAFASIRMLASIASSSRVEIGPHGPIGFSFRRCSSAKADVHLPIRCYARITLVTPFCLVFGSLSDSAWRSESVIWCSCPECPGIDGRSLHGPTTPGKAMAQVARLDDLHSLPVLRDLG